MEEAENPEETGAAAAGEWLSQSECARRLNNAGDPVTQQVLSRYLERYPDIPRRDQGQRRPMLVDFEALQRHRKENIQVQERAASERAGLPSADAPASPVNDTAADLRLRERRAATEKAEFELARARGELIPRAAVERAIRAAAVELEVVMKATRMERAEKLENTRDARAKVAVLLIQDDGVREKFAAALISLAAADENAADADAGEETGEDADDIGAETPTPPTPAAAQAM